MSKASSKSSVSQDVKLAKAYEQTKKRSEKLFRQRYPNIDEMEVIHRNAAGIDLGGKTSHYVAIEIGNEIEVREFGMVTSQLYEMGHYLLDNGVTSVAMESTGVYWVPVLDLFEKIGLEAYLVNPTHAKNVPGRQKTDKLDCRWLQKLHKFGLLAASFRPDEEIRPLRSYVRHRTTLVKESADCMRRMQKLLDMMNVRVHKAVSDMGGLTGMRILRAIVGGARDPHMLAELRDPRCKLSEEEIAEELAGFYQDHFILQLASVLRMYDAYLDEILVIDGYIKCELEKLAPVETDIDEAVSQDAHKMPKGKHAPDFNTSAYIELVTDRDPTVIPGIGPQIALGLLGELGKDMSKWPTVKHFGSYLGIAPQQKISGKRVLSSRTRLGLHPAAVLFKQAAAGILDSRDCALTAFYRQLAVRRGKGKALTALAYRIARTYYNLMKYGHEYVEIGERGFEDKNRERQIKYLNKKAKQLGFEVTPVAA